MRHCAVAPLVLVLFTTRNERTSIRALHCLEGYRILSPLVENLRTY